MIFYSKIQPVFPALDGGMASWSEKRRPTEVLRESRLYQSGRIVSLPHTRVKQLGFNFQA
jgi:hypothetical protein